MSKKLLLLFGLFIVVVFLFGKRQSSASDVTWLNAQTVSIALSQEFSEPTQKPTTTYGGNTNCSNRMLLTRPEKISISGNSQTQVGAMDCMNDTAYGAIGGSWLLRSGTGVAGPLTLRTNKEFVIGGPNLTTGILGDATAPVGVYLNFAQNINSQLKTDINSDGTVKHSLKNPNEIIELKNAKNERLIAYLDTITFSANGDHMLFDSPGYGLVRLETKTGKILSFGQPTNYNNGFNPAYQFAISANGRYVVQAGSNLFQMYDLSQCQNNSVTYPYLSDCSARNLEDLRISTANFGKWPAYIRFNSEHEFSYISAQAQAPGILYRKYSVKIEGQQAKAFQYLALGDSYASGEGAFRYKALTDMDNNRCHTSLDAYGFLIGSAMNYEGYDSAACSGAKMEDIIFRSESKYLGQYEDSLTQGERNLPDILNQFLPGKITQSTFVDYYDPEVVTISIGGNDLGFADKLKQCIIGVVPSLTCYDTESERRGIAQEVYNLVPQLVSTYQSLKASGRRVYVLGYPKVVAPAGNCAVNVRLNDDEIVMADRLTVLLNDAIEFAASQAGVRYVDAENILEGRRLCETQSDNTLVHGLTQARGGGMMGTYSVAQESFHPKADAQKLYRDAIVGQTNNLTAPMPTPAQPALFPHILNGDAFILGGQANGQSEYTPRYENLVPIRVSKGTDWPINLPQSSTGFPELSSVRAELHSEPVVLGNFVTNEFGDLNTSIVIPPDTKPGYHSIHIYGTTLAGEKIDFYDYLLISENTVDFDGDGIYDRDEGCVFGEPLGTDSDNDFTDDACDLKEITLSLDDTNSDDQQPEDAAGAGSTEPDNVENIDTENQDGELDQPEQVNGGIGDDLNGSDGLLAVDILRSFIETGNLDGGASTLLSTVQQPNPRVVGEKEQNLDASESILHDDGQSLQENYLPPVAHRGDIMTVKARQSPDLAFYLVIVILASVGIFIIAFRIQFRTSREG